jgi:hypothetical protein
MTARADILMLLSDATEATSNFIFVFLFNKAAKKCKNHLLALVQKVLINITVHKKKY